MQHLEQMILFISDQNQKHDYISQKNKKGEKMLGDPLLSVRAALNATTNTTGADARNIGGVEIQKVIDRLIIDDINRNVDLRPLIARKPLDQYAHVFNIRTDLGSSSKSAFYSDGGTGTPYGSTKIQYTAICKALRSDYAVTGLMMSASRSYYNALEDEARDAISQMTLVEEKSFICGALTSAYGYSGAYPGLLLLMGSNATFGDTDTIYGNARATARDELDVNLVAAGSTSTDALDLKDLDESIRLSDDAGAKGNRRIFFCSTARGCEINQLIQPQGRFVIGAGSLELEGGTRVSTYMGIPIVASRFMDKNGITWNGSTKTVSYADNAMYLLDLDNLSFRVLDGVDMLHVPVMGNDTSIRSDEQGGYFKTYGTFEMTRFRTQVLIYNLASP